MNNEIVSLLDIADENQWATHMSIHTEIRLKDIINPDALLEAAKRTKEHYIHLQIKPAIINEQLCYIKNDKELMIREIAHLSPIAFGKETNDFPYSISYDGCYITCVFHHGLFDGKSCFEVIKTLLYEYYKIVYDSEYVDESVYSLENPLSMEDQLEYPFQKYSKEPIGELLPDKGPTKMPDSIDLSHIGNDTIYYRIKCASEPFIKLVKELNTTPFAFFTYVIIESMRPIYKVANPYMMPIIISEFRKFFNSKCIRNFSGAEAIFYDTEAVEHLSLDMKCTVLRTKLDLKLDKDRIIANLKKTVEEHEKTKSMPFSMKAKLRADDRAQKTNKAALIVPAVFSYIGKINISKEIMNVLEDFKLTLPPFTDANMVECYDFDGEMIMNIYTKLKTDDVFRNIQKLFSQYGIESELENNGKLMADIYVNEEI